MMLTPDQIKAIQEDLRKSGQMPERGYTPEEIRGATADSATATSASRGVFACLRCKGIHATGYLCTYNEPAEANAQFAAYQAKKAELAAPVYRADPPLTEARLQALEEAQRNPPPLRHAGTPATMGYAQARTFTRDEVLTVLKADMAARAADVRPEETALLRYLIRLFERME